MLAGPRSTRSTRSVSPRLETDLVDGPIVRLAYDLARLRLQVGKIYRCDHVDSSGESCCISLAPCCAALAISSNKIAISL